MFQAAYLAKAGRSVAVLEKRHVVGGAAVTEEIVPGTEETRRQWTPYSAAVCCRFQVFQSILCSQSSQTTNSERPGAQSTTLLPHTIGSYIPFSITQKHGLKVYLRDPNAFAPVLGSDQYLLLGSDADENRRQIAKFSQRDAEVATVSFLGVYSS